MIANARQASRRISGVALGGLILGFVLVPPGMPGALPEGPLRIHLDPATALMGTPFSFTVTGLRPGERVVVKGWAGDGRVGPGAPRPNSSLPPRGR